MNEIYAVTGALGFLGNAIVDNLLSKGKTVRVLDIGQDKHDLLKGKSVTFYKGDICLTSSLEDFFKVDDDQQLIMIHAAGIVSISSKYSQLMHDVNVKGTQNIVDMALKYKIKRLVYVSSVHAIRELPKDETIIETLDFNPDKVKGEYSKSKAMATKIVLDSVEKGLDAVVVHPSGIIGPGDYAGGHTTQLVKDCANGNLTACVNGGYDFVDVRDVAEGVVLAAEKGIKGNTYILSGEYYPVKKITDAICSAIGRKQIKTILPLWFAKMTAPFAELYYRIRKQKPLFTRYSLYTLQSNSKFNSNKAQKELGYKKKFSLKQSIEDTYLWCKANNLINQKKKAKGKV
ncbi:MAG TPA: NAD-dependent epimerase/dehydratase family protein [Clostridia bacterium]|jgi:dihydroflavonol-4-reductase|nr:NAD-dependent epimerase/dehydratase family protein [Clostridiaceae bacterium]HXK71386.1 NAD-dependent epimerase/dehydratase family protein [Clostridia bacterium]